MAGETVLGADRDTVTALAANMTALAANTAGLAANTAGLDRLLTQFRAEYREDQKAIRDSLHQLEQGIAMSMQALRTDIQQPRPVCENHGTRLGEHERRLGIIENRVLLGQIGGAGGVVAVLAAILLQARDYLTNLGKPPTP